MVTIDSKVPERWEMLVSQEGSFEVLELHNIKILFISCSTNCIIQMMNVNLLAHGGPRWVMFDWSFAERWVQYGVRNLEYESIELSYIGYSLFYIDTMFCFCIIFNTAVGYPICTIHIRTDIIGYLAFIMTKLLHIISYDNIWYLVRIKVYNILKCLLHFLT